MVTPREREKLLGTPCPWCKARVGEDCRTASKRHLPITTLDGGCHDARWQAALGQAARVVMPDEKGRRVIVEPPAAAPEREPVMVGVALADRPW